MDEDQGPARPGAAEGGEGTAAVLYAIFTSFTESLGGLERRLDAIEAALREARPEPAGEGEGSDAAQPQAVVDMVGQLAAGLDQRLSRLEAGLSDLRALLQVHADETTHSLGRRAGDMGRRLASDLGLVRRPPPR